MGVELTNTQGKPRPKVKKSTIAVTATAILIIGLAGYFLRYYNKAVYPEISPALIYDFRDSSVLSALLENEKFDIDSNKVVTYYQLALDGGSEAQYEVGTYCYEMSWYEQALHWYILSAKQGNAKAANGIGRCFYNGYGTMKWPRNAYNWFRHSADGNSVEGMNNLAKCLVEGTGVITRNKKKALKYYKKAAELKNVPAEYNIGIHLFFGNGTKQRIEDGLYWLNKAANDGSASAQYSLGNIYREGLEGITIDLEIAESWYLKAINNSDEKIAAKAMDGMKALQLEKGLRY
jgi:TPR repeat protein